MLYFLQIKDYTFHQQKDHNSFYCKTHFTVVVWNPIHNIFEVRLYLSLSEKRFSVPHAVQP